jgi:hypothetical protein
MKSIGILETIALETARQNSYLYLLIEKILVEKRCDWLQCQIVENELYAKGYLNSKNDGKKYQILIKYSYFYPGRFDRIWIIEPHIKYHPKIHMYYNQTLCLYYPKDLPITRITPLARMLPWISEWVVKYEFWKKYKVWLGEEVSH